MLYVDRVETKWPLQIRLQIGSKVPLHCKASGKLFLSTLSKAQLRRVLSNLKLEKYSSKTMIDPKAITTKSSISERRYVPGTTRKWSKA